MRLITVVFPHLEIDSDIYSNENLQEYPLEKKKRKQFQLIVTDVSFHEAKRSKKRWWRFNGKASDYRSWPALHTYQWKHRCVSTSLIWLTGCAPPNAFLRCISQHSAYSLRVPRLQQKQWPHCLPSPSIQVGEVSGWPVLCVCVCVCVVQCYSHIL